MLSKILQKVTEIWTNFLKQGAAGTLYPHLFKKAYTFHKNKNTILPWSTLVLFGFLIFTIAYKIALRPVVVKGCTWILTESDGDSMARQGRVVAVEAQKVDFGTMTRRIQTVGKLTANASVTIRSEIHGRIKEISFTEGASVEKDKLLIQFEDDDIQAELKQAEAELSLRKAEFGRAQQLIQNKAGTTKDFDRAQAELAVSEGRVAAAKSKLAKTTIRAPFEGNIGIIHLSAGSYVQANQELVSLVDITPMKVDFKVPEKFVNDVGAGQTAEVKVQAYNDRVFQALVEAVDSKIETDNHSIAVKASIPNENGLLKAGAFAQISLIIGEKGNTIVVNEAAVDREGNIEFVWVVDKGRAHRQRVITGVRENQQIEIVAGLRPGQVVVTAGQIRLADGMAVNVTNMEEEKAEEGKEEKKPETQSAEKPAEKVEEKAAEKTEATQQS